MVGNFLGSISEIAAGNIGAAAAALEKGLARGLLLVIDFLARFLRLSGITGMIKKAIQKIRGKVDDAIDKVAKWVVNQAKRLGKLVAQAGVPQDPHKRLQLAMTAAITAARRLTGRVTGVVLRPILEGIQLRYGLREIRPFERGGTWWVTATVNPTATQSLDVPSGVSSDRPEGGVAADGPRLVIPVLIGSQSHEVIFEPVGNDVVVKMASVALPMTDVFAGVMNQLVNWRHYIMSIQEPTVRANFEPILTVINRYHGQNIAAFQQIYPVYHPRGAAPTQLPGARHRQAGIEVRALKQQVDTQLAEISGLVAGLGPENFDGLTPADFQKKAQAEGFKIWDEAWKARKAAIDAVIAGQSLDGQPVKYRGSALKGIRGVHKGKVRFNPADFDVDMYSCPLDSL